VDSYKGTERDSDKVSPLSVGEEGRPSVYFRDDNHLNINVDI